jgi:hypothetical protein
LRLFRLPGVRDKDSLAGLASRRTTHTASVQAPSGISVTATELKAPHSAGLVVEGSVLGTSAIAPATGARAATEADKAFDIAKFIGLT